MKGRALGVLAAGAAALAAVALVRVREPSPGAPRPVAAATAPGSVSAGGFTLASASIELPGEEQGFPDGPHVDVVNANCAACHSPSMILSQPPLSPDQWKAEVTKMREAYRAPVAEADVPAILAYLNALSAKNGAPATAQAQDPAPAASPRIR